MKSENLEKEFAEIKERHMYRVIAGAFIAFEYEDIYNHKLLVKEYGDDVLFTFGKKRAFFVADDLLRRRDEGEEKLYEKVYKMCWNRVKNRVRDDKSYTEN